MRTVMGFSLGTRLWRWRRTSNCSALLRAAHAGARAVRDRSAPASMLSRALTCMILLALVWPAHWVVCDEFLLRGTVWQLLQTVLAWAAMWESGRHPNPDWLFNSVNAPCAHLFGQAAARWAALESWLLRTREACEASADRLLADEVADAISVRGVHRELAAFLTQYITYYTK